MRYSFNRAMILPLTFRREEGRGEGSVLSLKLEVEALRELPNGSENKGLLSPTLSSGGGEGAVRVVHPTAHQP